MTQSTVPATKPEPVRLMYSITAGITTITAGIGGVAYFADNRVVMGIAAILTLICAGVNVALGNYTRNQVTPSSDVTAFVNENRQEVAGNAASVAAGTPVVTVTAEDGNQA